MIKNNILQLYMDLSRQWTNYFVDLHSENRLNTTDAKGTLRFKVEDFVNLQSIDKIYASCVYATLSPTIYNISSYSGNNTIFWEEFQNPGGPWLSFLVTVPDGNYSIVTFLDAFKVALEAESAASGYSLTYEFTYDASNGKVTIGQVADYLFRLDTLPANTGSKFNLGTFLGWNQGNYGSFESVPDVGTYMFRLDSPDMVDFAIPRAIWVRSNVIRGQGYETSDKNGLSGGGTSNTITVIPIKANGFAQNSFADYTGRENARIEVSNPLNSILEFTLTGEDPDFKIDIQSGWDVSLLIQYVKTDIKK